MHNTRYKRQRHEPDNRKSGAAQALVDEALAINHSLNTQADELALDFTAQPDHLLNQVNRQPGIKHQKYYS